MWFGIGKEVKDASEGVTNITSGIRHLFTGEVDPKILLELDKIDNEHTTTRWKADAMIPWYKSSRSIVLISLTTNWIGMTWFNSSLAPYWVEANSALMIVVTGAFFGSKGMELLSGKKH